MIKRIAAVTLVEILTVILIIGILIALALPKFGTMRERTLDREATANLRLIQAAEKIYRMEVGVFWPDSGTANTQSINTILKLDVSSRNWDYQASSDSGESPLDIRATRSNPPAGWGREFKIDESGEKPCCVSGPCPSDIPACE